MPGGSGSMHCDIVVATGPGVVEAVGGNVLDSVTRTRFPADASGYSSPPTRRRACLVRHLREPPRPSATLEPCLMTDLFAPLTLRGVTLKNRIGVSPMCQYSCAEDGSPPIGTITTCCPARSAAPAW